MPTGYAKNATYKVVVKNIHRAGKKKGFSTSYWVTLFSPSR
jgi:hypothetical protein